MKENPLITVITPTTGKHSLYKLNASLERQSVPWVHILLWDDKREGDFLYPDPVSKKVREPLNIATNSGERYSIVIPGSFIKGKAAGSALRSIGLMAANTPYIMFADDDVWYEPDHFKTLLKAVEGKQWAFGVRKVWTEEDEYLGEDHFESVGNGPERQVPYILVDNNTMIVSRRFGTSASCLYRETEDYNDDRLMTEFLYKHAGQPGRAMEATVNQVCPKRLEGMFKKHCTK